MSRGRATRPRQDTFTYTTRRPRRSAEEAELARQYEARRRFRFMLLERPLGPWRDSRSAAIRDGIDAGEASYDEQDGRSYLGPLSWIWEVEADDVRPSAATTAPKP
jgi:hypothetical protein